MPPVPGSRQLQVPTFLRRRAVGDALNWLVSQTGGRGSDRLTTGQMRAICDSQAVPSACKGTLKHVVSTLDWWISDEDEVDGKDIKDTEKGKHYYRVLRDMLDDGGNLIGFATGIDLFADDILTARQGGCWEVIRDRGGVAQAVLHVDAGTIRFTHDPKRPVYQVSPWGEVSEVWEADRFGQARWHPNPIMGAALLNRTPIQLAYSAIAILSSSDSYNFKIIAEPIPAGLLNLGPGFNREKALQWKASWDASMRGIQPEPIHVIYGTPQYQYQAFRPPPRDMAFDTSFHNYASLVAACFEMNILDIGILTRVATKAAAESQAEATERQGLRHLMKKIKEAIEKYILEEGVYFHWEDISPKDEAVEADIASKETARVVQAVQGNLITEEQGFEILQQMKHIPADMKYDAAEFEKRKQEAQEQFQQKQEAKEGGQQADQRGQGKAAQGQKGKKAPPEKKEVGKVEAEEMFGWSVEKKGKGKGHWEHRGRPGERGGSLPDAATAAQAMIPASNREELDIPESGLPGAK